MIKKYYLWREMTDDGLLKEPKKLGPYYDEDDINVIEWRGFDSEAEAIASFERIHKKHSFPNLGDLVLVTTYRSELDT